MCPPERTASPIPPPLLSDPAYRWSLAALLVPIEICGMTMTVNWQRPHPTPHTAAPTLLRTPPPPPPWPPPHPSRPPPPPPVPLRQAVPSPPLLSSQRIAPRRRGLAATPAFAAAAHHQPLESPPTQLPYPPIGPTRCPHRRPVHLARASPVHPATDAHPSRRWTGRSWEGKQSGATKTREGGEGGGSGGGRKEGGEEGGRRGGSRTLWQCKTVQRASLRAIGAVDSKD